MNTRTFLIIPAALVVAALAGCGHSVTSGPGTGGGPGSGQRYVPSTSVCYEPAYIRQHAPEGLCDEIVDDDQLSRSGR